MTSFAKLFGIIFAPIGAVLAISFYFYYEINLKSINDGLFHFMGEKWISVSALNMNNPQSKETYDSFKKASHGTDMRITLIAENGAVLNDSSLPFEDISKLQDHSLRNEFRNANLGEPSYDIRKSASTGINTIYYAKKLHDGENSPVLRIAYNAAYIDNAQKNLLTESAVLGLVIFMAVALIAAYLARKISAPVKNLDALVKNIEKGEKEGYFPPFDDPSFNKISEVIYNIYSNLIKEKAESINGREKLKTVFKAMNEGIILLDKNGNIIHVNDKACEYLGVKLAPCQNIANESKNIDLIVFFNNLENSDAKTPIKYKELIFEAYLKKLGDEKLIVFTEVTEKLNYETFKTELVGNLTHEIKTPLTLIMGASETILNDKTMTEIVQKTFLNTIYKNTVKLNELINETLELHKLEYQKNDNIVSAPANIGEIIEELKIVFQTSKEKEIIYDAPDIAVNIKSEHISSILTNLITNAQKYSVGNKILVSVKKEKKRVTLSVSDMGPLIPETERKRIFERFYTVSKSRTKNSSGSGLGLAIVKHIASIYKGSASVYQNDNDGNTFEVILKEK